MLSTGCEQAGQLVRNRASGYTTDRNGRWVKEPPIDMSCAYAAGGLTHKIADIYLTDKWQKLVETCGNTAFQTLIIS